MKLTTNLIIQNNEDTIEQTLASLSELDCDIWVADIGCKDHTPDICKSFGAKVIRLSFNGNYSAIRNELTDKTSTIWQFYIEPWEVLLGGHEAIKSLNDSSTSYFLDVMHGDILNKQIRICRKDTGLRFSGNFFEKIEDQNAEYLNGVIWAKDYKIDTNLIESWQKSNPLSPVPYYYLACERLTRRQYDEFLGLAKHYLFQEKKNTIQTTMTRYYCGAVECHIKKNYEEATRYALQCLSENILMAEFWCLLGDIYFQIKEFEKALAFYDNAIILGQRRLTKDLWPMHLPKYKDYPEEMIEKCKNARKLHLNR